MKDLVFEIVHSPTTRHYASGLAAVVAFFGLATLSTAGSVTGSETPPVTRINSLTLSETAGGAEIEIEASAPLTWLARYEESGDLVLRLPSTDLGTVSDITPATGIVASVVAAPSSGSPGDTEITVKTRARAAYATRVEGTRLVLSLRAAEATAAASLQAEPTRALHDPSTFSAPAPTTEPIDANEFRLGPGDVLVINVFGLEDLDRKVRVLRDGTISLPLLGSVRVGGRSVQQAESLIATSLSQRQLVRDPHVSIFVEEFVSRTVSVQGAVQQPGVYPLVGRGTLLDLLGAAGGLSESRGDRIVVLRGEPGSEERLEIDAETLIDGADLSSNLRLLAGDTILVPQVRQFRVYVTGAVEDPGPVEYQSTDGITILQAVTAAGGPTERTNLRNVHIIRQRPDGSQEKIRVNIKQIRAGKAPDVVLMKGDTVVVGEWFL